MTIRALCLTAWSLVLPVSVLAQAPAVHDHDATHDHGAAHDHAADHAAAHDHAAMHAADSGLSPTAEEQIRAVERSVTEFATLEAARSSGFRPALGMIPTMGTHWVNASRMLTGTGSDLSRPEHLMFSPVDGQERLVGVAFAYQARPGEETPDLFDGDLDAWHTHPELSPPGMELTMLHVWFVPSPDGPFAGHNPWLPYWAVGLEPPDAARLADSEDGYRIRALGLALAETVETARGQSLLGSLLGNARDEGMEPRRERIRELIPELERAQRAGDFVAWNRAADLAIAEWEEIRAANLAAIPLPRVRDRLAAFYEEMLSGGHGDHAH